MAPRSGKARPITRYGVPVLHRPAAEITAFSRRLGTLVDDMFASMRAANGVGLAANQIGVGLRVFVFDCQDETGERHDGYVINPVLGECSEEQVTDDEGCLSIPGPYARLTRARSATVAGLDLLGEPVAYSGTGMLARCLQHETDHLDGIVYVDHLPEARRLRVLAQARP